MADAKQSQISIEAPSPRGSGPVIPQLPQQADREQIRLEAEADRSQFSWWIDFIVQVQHLIQRGSVSEKHCSDARPKIVEEYERNGGDPSIEHTRNQTVYEMTDRKQGEVRKNNR